MFSAAILQTQAFWWAVLDGLVVTVALTFFSMALGFVFGTGLAWMHAYGGFGLRLFAKSYIFIFRGVPLLILLFLIYYGLPRIAFFRNGPFWDLVLSSPFRTALFAFTINNAAYLGEMIRGGLKMVPRGLLEAAQAVAMTNRKAFFRVHFPLALRSIVGSLGNETVAVLKASAIASVITVHDLMGGPTVLGKVYLDPLTPLVVVGVVYVFLVLLIDRFVRLIQVKLSISKIASSKLYTAS